MRGDNILIFNLLQGGDRLAGVMARLRQSRSNHEQMAKEISVLGKHFLVLRANFENCTLPTYGFNLSS
jgi:hypothetical protein